jgi:hypothetical protein
VVTNAREVFYTTAANEYYGVLLKVVSHARDIGGDFDSVGKTHSGYLSQRRIRFLGRYGHDTGAYATALWALIECWGLGPPYVWLPTEAD